MNEINNNIVEIGDIEVLENKKKEISELYRKIAELDEVKLLKKIEQEVKDLCDKIKKLSTYDLVQIGNVLARLMTEFEGISYHVRNAGFLINYGYCIEPKGNYGNIYPCYELKDINNKKSFSSDKEKQPLCFLPPSTFESDYCTNNDIRYIRYFIDYLYERRANQLLYDIDDESLDEILLEFLEITKDLQQQRKRENSRKIEEKLKQQKRIEFEKSCLIDRKLIFNSLVFIINHYEEGMSALQEVEEEWSGSVLIGYHKLTIKCGDRESFFRTKVDSNSVYPDEEYCGVFINIDKDTDICFFDIKREILPVLENSCYAIKFINMIEEKYEEKGSVSFDDIHSLLVIISNEKKEQQKVFKKGKYIKN